jgi:hypothetical protein
MAYATGSATTANNLLTAIKDFAQSNGWTIDKTATGLLFLHKGICYVAIQTTAYTYTDYATGVGVVTNDTRFDMAISTSFTIALNTFFGHPGSLSTTATDADRVVCNQLQGPFPEYHLFTDASGNYIHCAVRIGADNWKHISFGLIDKGNFSHSGAAYLTSHAGVFYRQNATATSSAQDYNDSAEADFPFVSNASRTVAITHTGRNFYMPDALPNTADWPVVNNNLISLIEPADKPSTGYPSTSSGAPARILNPVQSAVATQWGGNVMLFPIPVIFFASAISKTCYVGDYPDVRLVNMEGLQNGQELAVASDVWKIFSIGRQTPWYTQAEADFQYTTGQYGIAYKKIT